MPRFVDQNFEERDTAASGKVETQGVSGVARLRRDHRYRSGKVETSGNSRHMAFYEWPIFRV